MRSPSDLLAQHAVARYLHVTRSAVAQRIAAGKLETVEIGGMRFVPWRAVQAWKRDRVKRGATLQESGP